MTIAACLVSTSRFPPLARVVRGRGMGITIVRRVVVVAVVMIPVVVGGGSGGGIGGGVDLALSPTGGDVGVGMS